MGYLEIMRPWVCLATGAATLAGLAAVGHPWADLRACALTVLSVSVLMAAADALNDYLDRDIDRLNRPARPIPSGRVSPHGALAFSVALFAVGNAAALGVNAETAAGAAALTAAYVAYDVWSKRLSLAKNLLFASACSWSLLMAGLAARRTNFVLAVAAAHVFLMVLSEELVKDVEDVHGDAACGARTWALAAGAGAAMAAARASAAAGLTGALLGGLVGHAHGVFWPLWASGALLSLAAFRGFRGLRAPPLILGAAALVITGLVVGSL